VPIGTHKRSFARFHPRSPATFSSRILGFATPPKTPICIISGTSKDMDFKFGRYICSVHPNKSVLKILAYPGIVHILCPPPIISGTGKDINFKFCMQIHRIDWNRSAFRTFHISSRGHSQRLQKIFRAPIYMVHHAVLLVIARLSCKRYRSSKLIWEKMQSRCYLCMDYA